MSSTTPQTVSISYAITVCTEAQEFRNLLNFLVLTVRPEIDEIVVLQDVSKPSDEVDKVFIDFADHIETRVTMKFSGHFAEWKNELNRACKKDYIFQIDADEIPNENFQYLPALLEANPTDLFLVPRVNLVEGLTQEDIERWRWRVNEKGWINWPDYQTRIYRNDPKIQWDGKVHERIVGHRTWARLPDAMFLVHVKGIQKQREQNALYSQMTYGK